MPFLLQFISRRFTQEALFGLVELAIFMILKYEFMRLYKSYRNKHPYNNQYQYYGVHS